MQKKTQKEEKQTNKKSTPCFIVAAAW